MPLDIALALGHTLKYSSMSGKALCATLENNSIVIRHADGSISDRVLLAQMATFLDRLCADEVAIIA